MAAPYSYRSDAGIPRFDDSRPLIIFDGSCVLCSRGVAWMAARDAGGASQFAAIQNDLPRALYRHYGLDADAFDTFMVLVGGQPYTKWRGVLAAAKTMPQPYRVLGYLGAVVPRVAGDAFYDWIQRNRFSWFGARETCFKPGPAENGRFLMP